jgi:hypothetical protein
VKEQRKRPEIRFRWFGSDEVWGPEDAPVLEIGTEFTFVIALDNVGNGVAERATFNFIVPDFVELWFLLHRAKGEIMRATQSGDTSVGLPPDHGVWFLAPPMLELAPGHTWMCHVKLRVLSDPTSTECPGPFHMAAALEDPRLNVKGMRKLPVLVVPLDSYAKVPDPWPGEPLRRVLSRAHAQSRESVRIFPNRRIDRRNLQIGAATGAATPPVPEEASDQPA